MYRSLYIKLISLTMGLIKSTSYESAYESHNARSNAMNSEARAYNPTSASGHGGKTSKRSHKAAAKHCAIISSRSSGG